MTYASSVRHRTAAAAILVVGGGAVAVAAWIGAGPAIAIGLVAFYALAGGAAYVWAGRDSDIGAILRAGGDERQTRLDRDATAFAGLAMALTAIVGAIVSIARNGGDPGPYGVMCLVGGVAYALGLLLLKRKS
jgi:hypothetical protein